MIVCKNHQYVHCTLLGTYIILYICLFHFFKYKVKQYLNSSITTSYHDDDPTIQGTLTLSVEYTVHSSVCECFRIIVNLLSIILYLSSILSIPILPLLLILLSYTLSLSVFPYSTSLSPSISLPLYSFALSPSPSPPVFLFIFLISHLLYDSSLPLSLPHFPSNISHLTRSAQQMSRLIFVDYIEVLKELIAALYV